MKKKISIFGSTGSIGLNTLKIVSHLKNQFEVVFLTCNKNARLLIEQIKIFKPKAVCVVDKNAYEEVKNQINLSDVKVLFGRKGLLELAKRNDVDIMLNALVGASGMEPTLCALESGVDVALANKESLVMAGDIITKAMQKTGASIFPVDSEHSAIWQIIKGEKIDDIQRIILTGSGGPFRTRSIETFKNITVEEALNHPNWDMGNKITIDSATMMNKGLEVIEARWLFNLEVNQIDILIHPQSIIHSMVEFKDRSIKAQLGIPDMKIPIQYAITYPRHALAEWEKLDLAKIGNLTFEEKDVDRFPCIDLAYQSLSVGGSAPAVLNVANDNAVYSFLNKRIKFTDIPIIIEKACNAHKLVNNPSLEELLELELWTRDFVMNEVDKT